MVCWTPSLVRTSVYFLANFGVLNGCISFNIGPPKTIKFRILKISVSPFRAMWAWCFLFNYKDSYPAPLGLKLENDAMVSPLFQEKAMIIKIQLLTFDFRPFGPIITSKIPS